MQYQEVTNCNCEAQETDWLSVTYTQNNYIKEEKAKFVSTPKDNVKKGGWLKKNYKYLLAAVFLVFAVAGMLFVEIDGGVFQTARLAYTSTLMEDVGNMSQVKSVQKVFLPATQVVKEIMPDGTIVLSGGKVAQSLSNGTVTAITENTVTVQVDEQVSLVYTNLTDVLIKEQSPVTQYDCIGRYNDTMSVNVVFCGEVVKTISSGGYSFEWQV